MAANQSSPGVVFQERDLTTITTLSTANVGLLAAPFADGPVEQIVEIANERELSNVFGKPNENNYEYWFTASQFHHLPLRTEYSIILVVLIPF